VLLILFVIRPLAGMISLAGCRLPMTERWAISFFGIRGIGSIYYLSYGIFHVDFPEARALWAMVLTMVLVSIAVHGLSARPAMDALVSEDGEDRGPM